jgi:hypothetical protein
MEDAMRTKKEQVYFNFKGIEYFCKYEMEFDYWELLHVELLVAEGGDENDNDTIITDLQLLKQLQQMCWAHAETVHREFQADMAEYMRDMRDDEAQDEF